MKPYTTPTQRQAERMQQMLQPIWDHLASDDWNDDSPAADAVATHAGAMMAALECLRAGAQYLVPVLGDPEESEQDTTPTPAMVFSPPRG